MLGLFTFFYGCLHAWHYFEVDAQWNKDILWEDLTTRKFFLAGLLGLVGYGTPRGDVLGWCDPEVGRPAVGSWSIDWFMLLQLLELFTITGRVRRRCGNRCTGALELVFVSAYRTGHWIFEGFAVEKNT
jgi:hypothetical protein